MARPGAMIASRTRAACIRSTTSMCTCYSRTYLAYPPHDPAYSGDRKDAVVFCSRAPLRTCEYIPTDTRASVWSPTAPAWPQRSFVVVRCRLHLMQGELEKKGRKVSIQLVLLFPVRAGTHGSASLSPSPAPPIGLSVLGIASPATFLWYPPRSLSGFPIPATSSYTNLPLRSHSLSGATDRPTRPSPLPHTCNE